MRRRPDAVIDLVIIVVAIGIVLGIGGRLMGVIG